MRLSAHLGCESVGDAEAGAGMANGLFAEISKKRPVFLTPPAMSHQELTVHMCERSA